MENNKEKIVAKFQKDVHLWGRITVGFAFLFSLSIPIYLAIILKHLILFQE